MLIDFVTLNVRLEIHKEEEEDSRLMQVDLVPSHIFHDLSWTQNLEPQTTNSER